MVSDVSELLLILVSYTHSFRVSYINSSVQGVTLSMGKDRVKCNQATTTIDLITCPVMNEFNANKLIN